MKKKYFLKHSTRFRNWSRKKYAAFCSIGRCVTIGRLHKNVTEAALQKQKNVLLPCMCGDSRIERTEEEETEAKELPDYLLLLSLFLQPQKRMVGEGYTEFNYLKNRKRHAVDVGIASVACCFFNKNILK